VWPFHYKQGWTTSNITKNPRSSSVFRNGLISISDWAFGNVWSCSTLFIMKTSHKSDELKNKLKRGVHKSGTYVGYNGFLFPHSYSGDSLGATHFGLHLSTRTHLGLHLSTNAEKETRYIQYETLILFQ
jgi:hypothetical protein